MEDIACNDSISKHYFVELTVKMLLEVQMVAYRALNTNKGKDRTDAKIVHDQKIYTN